MAEDISGFGLVVILKGSKSGQNVFTQFADDADPFDIPEIQIADTAAGLNGDLVVWKAYKPIEISMALISASDDDRKMAGLWNSNRPRRGDTSSPEEFTCTGIYPNGDRVVLYGGVMKSGMLSNSVQSSARFKSKVYKFSFENNAG